LVDAALNFDPRYRMTNAVLSSTPLGWQRRKPTLGLSPQNDGAPPQLLRRQLPGTHFGVSCCPPDACPLAKIID
jgi:hypothetical protein